MSLTIVAHFTEPKEVPCAGLKDISIPIGIALHLREDFGNIKCLDVTTFPLRECGISKLVGNKAQNILIIQNSTFFNIDVSGCKIFYFHIDGTQSIHPNKIDFAFYLFNALGKHAYKVADNQRVLLPFANIGYFDPNREKEFYFSHITRDISYEEYKDKMERSEFLIVEASNWISKRALEALACKTIPIIITDVPEMYYRMGFKDEFCGLISSYKDIERVMKREYDINKGYEWLKKYHSAKVRIKQMVPFLKMCLKSPKVS